MLERFSVLDPAEKEKYFAFKADLKGRKEFRDYLPTLGIPKYDPTKKKEPEV